MNLEKETQIEIERRALEKLVLEAQLLVTGAGLLLVTMRLSGKRELVDLMRAYYGAGANVLKLLERPLGELRPGGSETEPPSGVGLAVGPGGNGAPLRVFEK